MGILSRIQAGLKYDGYMCEIMDPPLHGTDQWPIKIMILRDGLNPVSFATTKGIPVGFFSSPN